MSIEEVNARVRERSAVLDEVRGEIAKVIVGQEAIINRLLIGMLANGHVLIEGVPGLAKTLIISTLSRVFAATYKRIQFTPDLLPADITGTLIFNQKTGEFTVKHGPIFANFILADEINRAPSKVQSALLEAMQEHQVTIGDTTYPLPQPFFVMATQNPIEQEGTFPLPEAQVDRFLMKLQIKYPSFEEERVILNRMVTENDIPVRQILRPETLQQMRLSISEIFMEEKLKDYILNLVQATATGTVFQDILHERFDPIRSIAPRDDLSGQGCQGPRLFGTPRLRDPGRHQSHRQGRSAPPHHSLL